MYSFHFIKLIPIFAALIISVIVDRYFQPSIQLFGANKIEIYDQDIDLCFDKIASNDIISEKYKVVLLLTTHDGSRNAQIRSGIKEAIKDENKLILNNKNCIIYNFGSYYFVGIDANNHNLKKQAKALSYDPYVLSVIAFLSSKDTQKIEYIYNKYSLPLILPRATSTRLVDGKSFSFRSVNNNDQIVSKIIEKIKQDRAIKRIILLSNKKDEYSDDMRNLFIKALKRKHKNDYLFDDYQLNKNYEDLISKILDAPDRLSDRDAKTAIVFFPETGKKNKFKCDIDIDNINQYAHNKSMCNALKIFNAVNSKSNTATTSFNQNKYQFFTGDTFYIFIQIHRKNKIFTVNEGLSISTISFSLPWYDCVDSKQGWRYKSSYDSVRVLIEALESIDLENNNNHVVQLRNEVQNQLFDHNFFKSSTGEKKENESKIVKIDPNIAPDDGITCDDI